MSDGDEGGWTMVNGGQQCSAGVDGDGGGWTMVNGGQQCSVGVDGDER